MRVLAFALETLSGSGSSSFVCLLLGEAMGEGVSLDGAEEASVSSPALGVGGDGAIGSSMVKRTGMRGVWAAEGKT